jgi:metal-sulfur cluster biosynthetic enzyme
MSDASAKCSSRRSTWRSRCAVRARESALRRQPCVVTSSSPEQQRVAGWGVKRTIGATYRNAVATLNPMPSVEEVEDALSNVIDPELGLDFVELGLIYGVEVNGAGVHVTFTLTSPGCPIGPQVSEQIEEFVGELDGVEDVTSAMTFQPPWTPERMSEDAKFALGY